MQIKLQILSFFVSFLTIFSNALANEKILIITSSYNNAEFIEWQHKTFKKFLKDDYTFVVFNDAKEQKHLKKIVTTCKKYDIKCYRVPPEIHEKPYLERWPGESYHAPAVRNSNVVQYALDTVGFDHKGIVVVFDSDLFLVRDFSIKEALSKKYDIFAVNSKSFYQTIPRSQLPKTEILDYFWIGICAMNMKTMTNHRTINFNCGRVNDIPVDAGGNTNYYLVKEKPRVLWLDRTTAPYIECKNCGSIKNCPHIDQLFADSSYDSSQRKLIESGLPSGEFFHKGYFFHYRGGTNWNNKSEAYHNSKSNLVRRYINTILCRRDS